MDKAQAHGCKEFLIPYIKFKQLTIDVIQMKATCSKCGAGYSLVYLLEKMEKIDE